LDDFPVAERTNVWTDTQTGAFTEEKIYIVQTNTRVIERCRLMAADPGDLVLDRHAYTCGGDEPYEKLKKALRVEIDEAEWSKLYSTRSLPFEAPKKGKIAVKGINHCGDEVLKVFRAP
jgi:hypothetical protein